VGEFEVAIPGGIWVAIGGYKYLNLEEIPLFILFFGVDRYVNIT
jgi:hypothetical protein